MTHYSKDDFDVALDEPSSSSSSSQTHNGVPASYRMYFAQGSGTNQTSGNGLSRAIPSFMGSARATQVATSPERRSTGQSSQSSGEDTPPPPLSRAGGRGRGSVTPPPPRNSVGGRGRGSATSQQSAPRGRRNSSSSSRPLSATQQVAAAFMSVSTGPNRPSPSPPPRTSATSMTDPGASSSRAAVQSGWRARAELNNARGLAHNSATGASAPPRTVSVDEDDLPDLDRSGEGEVVRNNPAEDDENDARSMEGNVVQNDFVEENNEERVGTGRERIVKNSLGK